MAPWAKADVVLFEGFESTLANNWTVGDINPSGPAAFWSDVHANFGGEGVHTGTRKAYCAGSIFPKDSSEPNPIYPNSMTARMRREIDLSGFCAAQLTFWYKIPSIGLCGDRFCDVSRVIIQSSVCAGCGPGLPRTVLWLQGNPVGAWTQAAIDLTPYVGGRYNLTFEFESDESTVGEGWYLDDILVTGTPGPPSTTVTINFDDLAPGLEVGNFYGNLGSGRGVSFEIGTAQRLPVIEQVPVGLANSGANVLNITRPFGEFTRTYVLGNLTPGASRIRVTAGYFDNPFEPGATASLTLRAFNANHEEVDSHTATFTEGNGFHGVLEVQSCSKLTSFTVEANPDLGRFGLDDLTVSFVEGPDFELNGPSGVTLVQGSPPIDIPINIRRIGGSSGAIDFSPPIPLPNGVHATVLPNPANGNNAILRLSADLDQVPDAMTVFVTATTRDPNAGPVNSPRSHSLFVETVSKLRLSGSATINCSACSPSDPTHGVTTREYSLSRHPSVTGPINVALEGLPADVQGAVTPSVLSFASGALGERIQVQLTSIAGVTIPNTWVTLRCTGPGLDIPFRILVYGQCPQQNRNFIIRGQFFSSNPADRSANQDPRPISGADVVIYRDDPLWFDPEVAQVRTDTTGAFIATIYTNEEADYYAQLRLSGDDVNLEDAATSRTWRLETEKVSNRRGLIDLGARMISRDGGNGTPQSAIWIGFQDAVNDYRTIMNAAPPGGRLKVIKSDSLEVPFTFYDRIHWPDNFSTGRRMDEPVAGTSQDRFRSYHTVLHEYGHMIRHVLDGDFVHWSYDNGTFIYGRRHINCDSDGPENEGYAFNEGWGDYWSGDPGVNCPGTGGDPKLQGNVGNYLDRLGNLPNVGRSNMVWILMSRPGSFHVPDLPIGIHSVCDFRNEFFRQLQIMPSVGINCPSVTSAAAMAATPASDPAPTPAAGAEPDAASLQFVGASTSEQRAYLVAKIAWMENILETLRAQQLAATGIRTYTLRAAVEEGALVVQRMRDELADLDRGDPQALLAEAFQQRIRTAEFNRQRKAIQRQALLDALNIASDAQRPAIELRLAALDGSSVDDPSLLSMIQLPTFPDDEMRALFVVNNTRDNGPGSLRQAILDANAHTGPDMIVFNIPGTGVQTIAPESPLPPISEAVIIDGYTQPGARPNTLANGDNALLLVELNGANAGPSHDGLQLTASRVVVRGLIINRFASSGISVDGCCHVIEGCFVGTDATGTASLGDQNTGIYVTGARNLIGGTIPSARNVIAGHAASAIEVGGSGATSNRIQGNFIGTDVSGAVRLGNGSYGIWIYRASENLVGGSLPGAGNLISGHARGVFIYAEPYPELKADGNVIQGNRIGTDSSGTLPLGNLEGVIIIGSSNRLGGTMRSEGNVIAANTLIGVNIAGPTNLNGIMVVANLVQGNYIGTDATGSVGLGNGVGVQLVEWAAGNWIGGTEPDAGNVIAGNTSAGVLLVGDATNNPLLGNHIFDNGGLGIDLGGDGVSANDSGDPDRGPNQLQNFPIVTAAGSGVGGLVRGTLHSAANTTFRLEFFANRTPDSSGSGEGETFLGAIDQTTDGDGNLTFAFAPSAALANGQFVTVTATDPTGNTSEFSRAVPVTTEAVVVVINEWMACNTNSVRNPETGLFEPWVELYNPGDAPVAIGGYYLSSSATNATQYRIADNAILAPRGFAVFWANGQSGAGGSGGFVLGKEGGLIALYAPDLRLVDHIVYSYQAPEISQGRAPDGGPQAYYLSAPSWALSNPQFQLRADCPHPGVINVIPNAESGEANQNSEASLAAKPGVSSRAGCRSSLLISTFRNGPGPNPYFTSADGGATWADLFQLAHGDTTVEWGANAYLTRLLGLGLNQAVIEVQSSSSPQLGVPFNPMAGSSYAGNPDQPWLEILTVNGVDRLYVGFNDLSQVSGRTASVRLSLDGGATWNNVVIERVTPGAGQDSPAVRVAAAQDGRTVYALFQRWNGMTASLDNRGDIVVVRDDAAGLGGPGALPFGKLGPGSTAQPAAGEGTMVAQNIVLANATALGLQRIRSSCALAVDPNDAARVYVAHLEIETVNNVTRPRLRVHRSTDGGQTFQPIFSPANPAALPALAVGQNGTLGLLYTELNGNNLETHFIQAVGGRFNHPKNTDRILASFPNGTPARAFNPYIGDYQDLETVGNVFYGAFCAANDPDPSRFPGGVFYQRFVKDVASGLTLSDSDLSGPGQLVSDPGGTQPVAVSIDPFFFREDEIFQPVVSVRLPSFDLPFIPNQPCPFADSIHCLEGAAVTIAWPVPPVAQRWKLISAPVLTPDALWSPVDAVAVETLEGKMSVTVPVTDSSRFFMLQEEPATHLVFRIKAGAGGHGNVYPDGTFTNEFGASVPFVAMPTPGYQVDRWYIDGAVTQIGGAEYVLNVQQDHIVTVTFTPAHDLALSLSGLPDPVAIHSNVFLTIIAANQGANPIANVQVTTTVTNSVQNSIAIVQFASSQGICTAEGLTIHCEVGDLAPGESATIQLILVPSAEGELAAIASVHGDGDELDMTNNIGSMIIPVRIPPIIEERR